MVIKEFDSYEDFYSNVKVHDKIICLRSSSNNRFRKKYEIINKEKYSIIIGGYFCFREPTYIFPSEWRHETFGLIIEEKVKWN